MLFINDTATTEIYTLSLHDALPICLFIARISRGRTIRQFVTGVLLVPSLVSLLWFAVFGGAGIAAQRDGFDVAGQGTTEGQLFAVLEQYPLATAATVLVRVLVAIDRKSVG